MTARVKKPRPAIRGARTATLPGALAHPHRWALASDGALVLLGTHVEIARPAARALLEFVRRLDKGTA